MPPDCYARSARPQPDAAIAEIRTPPPTPARASPPPGRSAPRTPAVSVLILSHYVEPRNATRLPEEHPERVGYLLKEHVFDVAVLIDTPYPVRRSRVTAKPPLAFNSDRAAERYK